MIRPRLYSCKYNVIGREGSCKQNVIGREGSCREIVSGHTPIRVACSRPMAPLLETAKHDMPAFSFLSNSRLSYFVDLRVLALSDRKTPPSWSLCWGIIWHWIFSSHFSSIHYSIFSVLHILSVSNFLSISNFVVQFQLAL